MAKDNKGRFQPAKGKPSGAGKPQEMGIHPTDIEKLEEYFERDELYTEGDALAADLPLRHPNRNISKGEPSNKLRSNSAPNKAEGPVKDITEESTEAEQLPGILSRRLFTELADHRSETCISIYLPTNAAGMEVNEGEDSINLKTTLQNIESQLKEKGLEAAKITRMLQPGHDLVRSTEFRTTQSRGLAIFICDDYFKYIKMPVETEAEILIENSFYVTPLVQLITQKEYFYILTISKHKFRLFKADAFGVQPVPVDLPEDIMDVKRLSEKDASTWRTGGRGGTGGANFHGSGGGNPDDKTNIAVYFEYVDDLLWQQVFNKENAPLLLAGVEYEIPIYRSVCDYHNVHEGALTGSREYQEAGELYKDAMEIMQPYFNQRKIKALEFFGNQLPTGTTASDAHAVIPAAHYARVAYLFVRKGEHVWGTFDEQENRLNIHDSQKEDSEDLLDHAVVRTLAGGGEVFLMQADEMPVDSPMAAVLRY